MMFLAHPRLFPQPLGRRVPSADPGVRGFAGLTLGYNTRSREDVGAVLIAAEAAGGADPDGHAWEVSFSPFWPLLADGSVRLPNTE